MKALPTGTMGVGLALSLTLAGHAQAAECQQIRAEIISTQDSPTSTVGTIRFFSDDGNQRLSGTTAFSFDSTAPGPSTAPNPTNTISYSGVLKITTAQGTLTSRDTGIFDTSTRSPTNLTGGLFSSFDIITGGTGIFAGTSGTFQIIGSTVNGKFVSELRGSLCRS